MYSELVPGLNTLGSRGEPNELPLSENRKLMEALLNRNSKTSE
jgi:hypothetical protein